jgi:hypothetical protein
MRKSAKRGEPQIFLLCVTLWAWAGGVVSPPAFAVPSPTASAANKSAPPWPRHIGRGVGAFLSPQPKRDTRPRPQKSRHTSITLACRTGRPPNGRLGTRWRLEPFTASSMPNDCCPRKRHVWGTRQSRWFRGPAALLCELSRFVLAVTSRKIDPRSDPRASDIKRPVIVPHTAKGANFDLDLHGCRGLLFT